MDSIENLKTDANIASILNKLKNTKQTADKQTADKQPETKQSDAPKDTKKVPSLMVPVSEIPVASMPEKIIQKKDDAQTLKVLKDNNFIESTILPWFDKSDLDLKLLHYAQFNDSDNDSGSFVNTAVKTNNLAKELASIKMKKNFACDVDYYTSKHFVLCVKRFESDYQDSRSYSKMQESMISESETPKLVKTPTEDVVLKVASNDKYNHYVVFTDLGIADFIARQDDLEYPYGTDSLSKWFEETSNFVVLKCPNYQPNPLVVSDDVDSIKEFKYDLITMHRPGIITLDSLDNDSDYQLHIKLKDEFSFIPMGKILKCLKQYSNSSAKKFSDFKRFINRYFDIVISE